MAAVHRLPAGHELQEEDAECEHVRLLVDDAVRVVLRRQAPDQQETTPSFHPHGHSPSFRSSIRSRASQDYPKVPSMGAIALCVHSDGSHLASPKSEICNVKVRAIKIQSLF